MGVFGKPEVIRKNKEKSKNTSFGVVKKTKNRYQGKIETTKKQPIGDL